MQGSGNLQAPIRPESRKIDDALVARAINLSLPLIENAMRDPAHGDSGFLHIVVMDPARSPRDSTFEEAILREHSVGDRSRWDADYAAYARGKAERSWRSYSDNPKGAVWLEGIVVGASGAFECFDRGYAVVVAAMVRALAHLEAKP